MRVKFKPAGAMLEYHSDTLHCNNAGEFECSDEKAAQLVADFPLNFEKAESKPSSNKMAEGPSKNK